MAGLTRIAGGLALGAAAILALRQRPAEPGQAEAEPGPAPAPAEPAGFDLGSFGAAWFAPAPAPAPALVLADDTPPAPTWAAAPAPDKAEANTAAFLAMIRTAEGTADPDGYRALFGHNRRRPRLFDGWADHPRIAQQFTDGQGRRLWTSAAGAYQFMAISPIPGGGATKVNTWDRIRDRLRLPDFSPASQDRAALELIREAGALGDVRAGRLADAIRKVRKVWASLPGAGYNQPERSADALQWAYISAGGNLA